MSAFILHSNTLFVMLNQYASYLQYELSQAGWIVWWQSSKATFQKGEFRYLSTIWTHRESKNNQKKTKQKKKKKTWSNSSGAKRACFTILTFFWLLLWWFKWTPSSFSCFSNFCPKTSFYFTTISKISGCRYFALKQFSHGCRWIIWHRSWPLYYETKLMMRSRQSSSRCFTQCLSFIEASRIWQDFLCIYSSMAGPCCPSLKWKHKHVCGFA